MSTDVEYVVRQAREACRELIPYLREKHPEYLPKYLTYCGDYLVGNYSDTQKLLVANDVLMTLAWAKHG